MSVTIDPAAQLKNQPAAAQKGEAFQFHREIIVCGDDPLANTIIDELRGAGARIIRINSAADLLGAGVHRARAVVCAGPNDAVNLEIALLARRFSPNVRVVARLADNMLRDAVAAVSGPGAILNVADLAAPSIIEAVLSRNAHQFATAGVEFVIWGSEAPKDGTLRDLYKDLAPVAVVHGKNSPTPGEVVPCPGRDLQIFKGDWTSMIGPKDEMEARGISVPSATATRSRHSRARRAIDAVRAMREDANPLLFPSAIFTLVLIFGATTMVRFSYVNPKMSWLDALYFTSETITSVGFGDFSFAAQSGVLRWFAIGLMFGGVTITAILVALISDLLLSRRFVHTAGLRRARRMRDHIIVVGLGSTGIRVVSDLVAAGYDVVVIEQDENSRLLSTVAKLDVPVIFGDSTMRQTLESARARSRPRSRGDDPGRHGEHPDRHRSAGTAWIRHQSADRAACAGSRAERRGKPAIRLRERAVGRGSGGAVVHRRGDGFAGARERSGSGSARSWSARCWSRRAASSTGCKWRTCRLRRVSSRSSARKDRCGCAPAAVLKCKPATRCTSSARIAS